MKIRGFTLFIARSIKRNLVAISSKSTILGKGVVIDFGTLVVTNDNHLYLGNYVHLRSRSKGYHASMPFPTTLLIDTPGAKIHIDDRTRINGAYIHAQKKILIGHNCVVASGVNIIDSNGHELYSNDRTVGRDQPEAIIIGNNVWIGLNAIILKGTNIGDNCVVSAGSVVKGYFAANSLIVGNPAKVVKEFNI